MLPFTLANLLLSALVSTVFAASVDFSAVQRRALSPPSNLPAGFSYLSCSFDYVNNRQLTGASYFNDSMTDILCINYCGSQGYRYAGTEYARECYCGYSLGGNADPANDDECSMACGGDATQPCGGPNRLSVFYNRTMFGKGPYVNPGPPGWTSYGCYNDSVNARALSVPSYNGDTSPQMTVALCTSICSNKGYAFAGLEYGGECYCGPSLQNGARSVNNADCSMTCKGNSTEFCGDANRINIYHANPPTTTTTTTSTTTTTTTTSTVKPTPIENIYNGNFEQGALDYNSTGSVYPTVLSGGGAHGGNRYGAVQQSTDRTTGVRSVCFLAYPDLVADGNYIFTFYIGKISLSQQPQTVKWTASLDGAVNLSGVVCDSGCTEKSVDGSYSYSKQNVTWVNPPQGYKTVSICAIWNDAHQGQNDVFIIDDVSLMGPY